MPNFTRLATATLLLGLMATPVLAAGIKTSPAGSWQSSDGQARVRVTLCGDGTQLCATLTAVSGEARTPQNLQLLNSYVVERAQLADTNTWQGTVHFNGQTASGQITLISASTITVSGCQLGMCKTFEFRRLGNPGPVVAVASAQMSPRTVALTLPE
ncbi:MAG: DUF2147 domain-containing protein [Devosia sp.]|nr:DUF2147 domain-containing protein [Devosia sp.]